MTEEAKDETGKPEHQAPAGAEIKASWGRGKNAMPYSRPAKWIVLRKKEKPSAEIFSVAYVAGGRDRDGR